ncbi:uncharacterized protein LOC143613893 [Bidens hawaiensis]|uniref:uncharacterized protein LOC143613893 n=1 Tax=Bidens hawaiensis TaxID=980011 RepID=UPI00404A6A94
MGRAFHMTTEEAKQADDVITGTFLLNKLPATVLFDSGANKSFISYKFCHALRNPLRKLEQSFTLEIADGKQIEITDAIDDCFLNLESQTFPIRTMVTTLGEFDLVIGMDWLAAYKAQINCGTKSINLQAPDGSIVTIYGDREKQPIKIISAMKATKMIHHGCFAHLAYAIDTQKETKKVEEVSAVCEFPDVFPDESPGIPPDREVEFKIDLVPGAKPVAKAPYRLAPSEMKELMIQIQELLDKGFIRPRKANVVADALSRKEKYPTLKVRLYKLILSSELMTEIKATQTEALKEENVKKERIFGQVKDLTENENGIKLRYDRIWIPKIGEVKKIILDEAHKSRYSIHPGATKMYYDLKRDYWWPGMKQDIVKYIEKCLTCLQVKAEHQKPYGKLQPLEIPTWKWEHLTMDFITKLPRTVKNFDSIWVIVDRLTKNAHFLPIGESYTSEG